MRLFGLCRRVYVSCRPSTLFVWPPACLHCSGVEPGTMCAGDGGHEWPVRRVPTPDLPPGATPSDMPVSATAASVL